MMATGKDLPAEILLLIADVLVDKRDFNSLFAWALTSRRFALVAIPVLYGSYELSPAFAAEIFPIEKTICLWRSIILSSVEKTFFPYALYIKTLKLGVLHRDLLCDVAGNAELRDKLFEGPMARFRSESMSESKAGRHLLLNFQAIVDNIGDVISRFLGKSMSITGKFPALESLEGNHLRPNLLPVWTSRMPRLASLQIHDGSAIQPELGTVLANSCPLFKELRCYLCMGNEVDQDMASFILALPQNQLQMFGVMSGNFLGEHSFKALGVRHGDSLRIFSMQISASGISAIPKLKLCTALRYIALDFDRFATGEEEMQAVGHWLKKCERLSQLEIRNSRFLGHILRPVLDSAEIRLQKLIIDRSDMTGGRSFFEQLGNQTGLEVLEMTTTREEAHWIQDDPEDHVLVWSIQKLQRLHTLMLRCLQLDEDYLNSIVLALPKLEHFSWSTDMAYDESLTILEGVPRLKSITCHGISQFSFEAMRNFIRTLAWTRSNHRGFKFNVMNQYGVRELKLSQEEEESLKTELEETLGGSMLLVYVMDEDVIHEVDFSE